MSVVTSIQSNQIFSNTSNSTSHVNTKTVIEAEKKNTSQNKKEGVVTSKDGDTLEISATATTIAAKNEISTAVSGESSSSTSDLSSYSAVELKEMLQNGEITQTEYDTEMESRSSSTDSTNESINDQKV